jgi:hypothetical protein
MRQPRGAKHNWYGLHVTPLCGSCNRCGFLPHGSRHGLQILRRSVLILVLR